jgi:hypothetical protein
MNREEEKQRQKKHQDQELTSSSPSPSASVIISKVTPSSHASVASSFKLPKAPFPFKSPATTLAVPSLKTLLMPATSHIPFLDASESDNNATVSLPRTWFDRGELTFGLGECRFWFAHGERWTDGVRWDCARARGDGLEGVVVGGFWGVVVDFVGVFWGLEGALLGAGEGRVLLCFEGWGVSPFPRTDAELDAGIEATLEVRTRTDAEGVFLCFEGLGDVKLMTGEARCFCGGVGTDVSDMTRARDGVDGTALRFPLTLGFPIVLVEVEADNERGKALGGPAGSGRWDACREILGRFKGVGVALGERAFEVEFELEMDLVELGLIVVHPLASLVMDNARVLMEARVLEDVVRDSESRERVDVSEGVGMIAVTVNGNKVDHHKATNHQTTRPSITQATPIIMALWPSG